MPQTGWPWSLASLQVKHFGSVAHTSSEEEPAAILEMRLRAVVEKERPLGLKWLTELSQRLLVLQGLTD